MRNRAIHLCARDVVLTSQRRVMWTITIAVCAVAVARADDALLLPPVIPPDSVFSDGQRGPLPVAMIPPSSDHAEFLTDPKRPTVTGMPPSLPPPPDADEAAAEIPILGAISGPEKFVKQMTYRKTFLPPSDYLSIIDIAIEATIAPKRLVFGAPLWFTPFFTFHFFEGTKPFPMTSSTYDAGGEIRQVYNVTPRLAADIAVAPSVYTDFMNNQPQTFRVVGRGVAMYQWSPTTQFALGATYLGRDDIKMLPVAGVLWRPNPFWEVNALFSEASRGLEFLAAIRCRTILTHEVRAMAGFLTDPTVLAVLGRRTRRQLVDHGLQQHGRQPDLLRPARFGRYRAVRDAWPARPCRDRLRLRSQDLVAQRPQLAIARFVHASRRDVALIRAIKPRGAQRTRRRRRE